MQVFHDDLYKFKLGWSWDECFNYSKQAEQALAYLLGMDSAVLSDGYAPGHDIEWHNRKFEVKFQCTMMLNVEFCQQLTRAQSGILTTSADYWLVVSTGYSRGSELVGKVRQYRTEHLLQSVTDVLETTQLNTTYCRLDPRAIPHVWLGDLAWDQPTRVWKLSDWYRRGYQVILN